jgi:hypothetical protein
VITATVLISLLTHLVPLSLLLLFFPGGDCCCHYSAYFVLPRYCTKTHAHRNRNKQCVWRGTFSLLLFFLFSNHLSCSSPIRTILIRI